MNDANATVIVPEPEPRRLAQYELLRQVGAGAMGAVFLGRDVDLDRRVAIKLLHTGGSARSEAIKVERFLREARTAAQLVHPNVAIIYQVGRHEGEVFIAMEWLDGVDLGRWVETQGPLPWRDALRAVADATAGLAAAHAVGLVHRDIKPSNLMRMPNGQVKLVDFGLARWHGMESQLTQAGGLMGTPAYMSPEQCWGEEATPSSDLYALGCTLYTLIAGRLPFDAESMPAVLNLQVNSPMPDVRDFAPEVPPAVTALIQRAAAKAPGDRHASAHELLADLEGLLDDPAAAPQNRVSALTTVVAPVPFRPGQAPSVVATAPPLPPAPPPGHLPADSTSFVGREALLERSLEMLSGTRLLTLIGPGGTGKTRLSLQTARLAAPDFPDGAWFVELATVPAGQEIESAIAAVLGVAETAGRPLATSIVEKLQSRRLLLVLDNCEQVIDRAAAFAAPLLAAAPQVKLLTTSRQPLGVPGEELLPVPPLSLADDGASPEALLASEAVQLFAARARAVRPAFALDATNTDAVVEICRRLDGIPLAIELAAARVKVLAPAQIASRLGDAFKLLVGGQRTLLQRQQTLRALFDWSYDLLDDRERLLFARLSVFRGDFDLEAAEAVLSDDALDVVDVLDVLTELVDRSLVIAADHDAGMRYRLLQTTQQYAAERMAALDAGSALQRRHAEHYTQLVQGAAARLNGKEHAAAIAAVTREADNARAALDAATTGSWFDVGVPLASALAAYWFAKGVAIDGVARIQALLERRPPPSVELALLLKRAGTLAVFIEKRSLAASWLDQGLEIARQAGELVLQSDLLRNLGNLAYRETDMERASGEYLAAIEVARRGGYRLGEAMASHNLASMAFEQSDYGKARQYLERSLQIERETGDQRSQSESLRNLALVEFELGNDAQAWQLFESCLQIHQTLGDQWGSAYTRWQIGRCQLARGDVAAARETLRAALAAARKLDDRSMIAYLLDLLALASAREGNMEGARAHLQQGLAMRQQTEAVADLAFSLVTLAEIQLEHDPEHSARLLGGATTLRAEHGVQLQSRKQAAVDALRQSVVDKLGAQTFERAYAEGCELDLPTLLAQGGCKV